MLAVQDLSVAYGRVPVLFEVDLEVGEGELVALIGANGAGKSTLVNTISGINRPSSGTITFDGSRLDRLAPAAVVRAGVVQVAEGRQLFPMLTVDENLTMGAYRAPDRGQVEATRRTVYDTFPILHDRRAAAAQTMSGGEQQMLAIGRAMMAQPRMLIFDEPSLGLAPLVIQRIFEIIRLLNERGLPILLIEQNVLLSLNVSSRAYVMERGRITLKGPSAVLRRDPHVEQAYLGI